jgi:hypothetical protein
VADAATYYARRSARDPDWRQAQLAAAADREARRRAADPDRVRELDRRAARRSRRRQAVNGLTFHELLERSPTGDRTMLASVLRDELRLGRISWPTTPAAAATS